MNLKARKKLQEKELTLLSEQWINNHGLQYKYEKIDLKNLGRVDAERAFTGRGTKKSFRRDEEESVANLKQVVTLKLQELLKEV